MIVGIVSDLHGVLPDGVKRALAPCDAIICAGDVERPPIIWELETIAPVYAVLGNCDRSWDFGQKIPALVSPLLGGVRFRVVHRLQDVGCVPDDVDVVVFGHTHVPHDSMRGHVRYLNPGSPTRPRNGSDPSVIIMRVNEGRIENVEFASVFGA